MLSLQTQDSRHLQCFDNKWWYMQSVFFLPVSIFFNIFMLTNKMKPRLWYLLSEEEQCHFLCCQLVCSSHGQRLHPPGFFSWGRKHLVCQQGIFFMAPFGLRFFAPVMKSKKDWERLCSHKFAILVETVSCCDHPGASDLCEMKILGSTVKPTRVPLQEVLM